MTAPSIDPWTSKLLADEQRRRAYFLQEGLHEEAESCLLKIDALLDGRYRGEELVSNSASSWVRDQARPRSVSGRILSRADLKAIADARAKLGLGEGEVS